jgi:hypothetical protein
VDWIIQSRINDSLNNVNSVLKKVNDTLRSLQQELLVVQNRLAGGYKKRQKTIEEYKKEH